MFGPVQQRPRGNKNAVYTHQEMNSREGPLMKDGADMGTNRHKMAMTNTYSESEEFLALGVVAFNKSSEAMKSY